MLNAKRTMEAHLWGTMSTAGAGENVTNGEMYLQ